MEKKNSEEINIKHFKENRNKNIIKYLGAFVLMVLFVFFVVKYVGSKLSLDQIDILTFQIFFVLILGYKIYSKWWSGHRSLSLSIEAEEIKKGKQPQRRFEERVSSCEVQSKIMKEKIDFQKMIAPVPIVMGIIAWYLQGYLKFKLSTLVIINVGFLSIFTYGLWRMFLKYKKYLLDGHFFKDQLKHYEIELEKEKEKA